MSLVAWYPLNGDTLDYSGNDNTCLNYGAVVNASGKIGQCYNFNGTSSYMTIPNPLKNANVFTISFWLKVKSTKAWSDILTFNTGDEANAPRLEQHSTVSQFMWYQNNGFTSGSILFNHDGTKWEHITLTVDNTTAKCYKDGILQTSYARHNSSLPDCDTINLGRRVLSSYIGMDLNDLRFYNHALSEKEIKEISKAKILHYTFDDLQEPTENMIINGDFSDGDTGWTITTGVGEVSNNYYLIKEEGGEKYINLHWERVSGSGDTWPNMKNSLRYTTPGTYTLSCEVRLNSQSASAEVRHSAVDNDYGTDGFIKWDTVGKATGIWHKVSLTRTFNAAHTINGVEKPLNACFELYSANLHSAGRFVDLDVRRIQIEKKPYATPYVNSSRIGKVKDTSGLKKDATLVFESTPQWTSESKLGVGAYKFTGGPEVIMTDKIFNIGGDQLTLAAWVYPTGAHTDDRGIVIQENGNYYLTVGTGQQVSAYWFGTVPEGYHTTTDKLELNKWSHIASVWTGTYNNIYINGVLSKQTAVTGPGKNTNNVKATIGRESTRRAFKGSIDDVRIYNTALTTEDIKELYEVRASLDNKGNIYFNELHESENLAQQVNRDIANKTFTNVLTLYKQENCQVTLTDRGYRIYRPPNLTVAANGNTMWGGLKLRLFSLKPDIIKKGRKYRISFMVSGQSSNNPLPIYFSNQMGWSGGGLIPVAAYKSNRLGTEFTGSKEVFAEFNITDDIFKTCTASYGTFVAGESYNCYVDLCWGFEYEDTGALGTDLYITNFQLKDITEDEGFKVTEKGIVKSLNISEAGVTEGLVAYYPLNGNVKDYSGSNYNCSITGSPSIVAGVKDSAYRVIEGARISTAITNMTEFTNINKGFTISAYINCSGTVYSSGQGIVFGGTGYNWGILYNSSGSKTFSMSMWGDDGTTKTSYNAYTGIINNNQWYHVVGYYDASTNKVGIYLNGVLQAVNTLAKPFWISGNTLQFGNSGYYWIDASICDARVYNRVLSAEEVAILYESTNPSSGPLMKLTKDTTYIKGEFKEVVI